MLRVVSDPEILRFAQNDVEHRSAMFSIVMSAGGYFAIAVASRA